MAFMGRISFTLFNYIRCRCLDFLLVSSNSYPKFTDIYKNVPRGLVDFGSGQVQIVFRADQEGNVKHSYSHEHTKENGSSSFLIHFGKCFNKIEFFQFFSLSSLSQEKSMYCRMLVNSIERQSCGLICFIPMSFLFQVLSCWVLGSNRLKLMVMSILPLAEM